MTANYSKSYTSYLNISVEQSYNTTIPFIKKPIKANNYVLTEQIEANPKSSKFKFNGRVELLSIKIFLVKVTMTICQGKYLLLILFWFRILY